MWRKTGDARSSSRGGKTARVLASGPLITGIPAGGFLCNLRPQRAKEPLLTTDLFASEVCFEGGYASLGTFTTRFTQLVGVSPGRMRRLTEELSAALEGIASAERPPIPPKPEIAA
ncbi:MAG TPA: helix-turn-helix domain-containing protein [Rubrobacteraceae bacterium]|nr:helix-turn-helix domain-containing protein [Rubrobacteraceae bacterium]